MEKREKNEEYILVKDMEGLDGKSKLVRIDIFSQKGNNEKNIIFFPISNLDLTATLKKTNFEMKDNLICGFQVFFFDKRKLTNPEESFGF